MKKSKKILGLIIGLLLAVVIGFAGFSEIMKRLSETIIGLSEEEKLEDFEYVYSLINDSFPFGYEVQEMGIDKEEVYKFYKDKVIESKTDIEFMKAVDRFVSEFKGQGHFLVFDGRSYKYYKDALDDAKGIKRSEVDDKIVNFIKDVINTESSKNTYAQLDSNINGFRSVKFLKKEHLEGSQVEKKPVDTKKDNINLEIVEENVTAVLTIDSFELEYIVNDKVQLSSIFEKVRDYTNIIIDIRENSGGSDQYWENFIVPELVQEALASQRYYLFKQNDDKSIASYVETCYEESDIYSISSLPELESLNPEVKEQFSHYVIDETVNEPNGNGGFAGNVYVLTSDKVYSASENFVMFCKNTGLATLVGTNTGGDGGAVDPVLVPLPHSGLILRYSMFYGLNADGSGNEAYGTKPDVLVEKGKDALEGCLEYIKNNK